MEWGWGTGVHPLGHSYPIPQLKHQMPSCHFETASPFPRGQSDSSSQEEDEGCSTGTPCHSARPIGSSPPPQAPDFQAEGLGGRHTEGWVALR